MWTATSEVFEFNKMLFVYSSTILIAALWIVKSVSSKKFSFARTPLDIPILLFFLSQLISTFLSIDRHTSVWGYYSRFHGGFASTVSYIVLFYALVSNMAGDKKAQRNILWSIIGSAILVSIYGVLEHFGIDKSVWVQDVQSRVFSTLGQPNWLSAYLLAVLPLTLLSAINSKDKKGLIVHGLISLLFLITILFTKSRSGIGATFVVLFLIFILNIKNIFAGAKKNTRFGLPAIVITLFITIFLIGTPWTPNPETIGYTNTYGGPYWPAVEKYLNKLHLTTQAKPFQVQLLPKTAQDSYQKQQQGIRVGGSDSMEIRSVVWQGAVELTGRYPFFGTGVDTFGYSYFWVRPASHNLLSEWDFLYNRAHNEYLNFAATTGLLGLGSYLLFIGATLYIFIKAIKKGDVFSLSLLLGFVSILVTNYFGFSVVCIAIFFFLFPALSIMESSQYRLIVKKTNMNVGLTVFVIGCVTLYLLVNTYHSWTADISYAKGKSLLNYGASYLSDSLKFLGDAVKTNKDEPLYQAQLGEAQSLAALYINEEIKTLPATVSAEIKTQYLTARDQYIKAALKNVNDAINSNPYQTNYYKSKAKVGLYLASIDPQYYNEVITSLLQVSAKAPTDAKVLYNLGLVYSNMKKYDEAKQALEKAIELKPDYTEAQGALDKINGLLTAPAKKK